MAQKQYKPRKKNDLTDNSDWVTYARYSGLAFQMGILIALFSWGGYELDKWLENSFPIFLSIGLFLGIAMGIYVSIKDFIKKK